jgi:hypothetical protein
MSPFHSDIPPSPKISTQLPTASPADRFRFIPNDINRFECSVREWTISAKIPFSILREALDGSLLLQGLMRN